MDVTDLDLLSKRVWQARISAPDGSEIKTILADCQEAITRFSMLRTRVQRARAELEPRD
jgi:hypothetical protein